MTNKAEKIIKLFLVIAIGILLISVVFAQDDVQKIDQNGEQDEEQQEELQEETQEEQEEEETLEEQLQELQQQQQEQIVGITPFTPPTPAIPEDATQDFIIQVVDYQPKVIRSDLLEEQASVPVYAQIALFQVNPIISVPIIRNVHAQILPQLGDITFPGDFVDTVTKQVLPGKRLTKDNAGYLVIRLKGGLPEAEWPDKLTIPVRVTVKYDVEYTPGMRHETKILVPYPIPQKDQDWQADLALHSFWNKAGYVRITDIRGERVTGQVYDSRLTTISSFDLTQQRREQPFMIPQMGRNILTGEGQGKVVLEGVTDSLEKRAELLISLEGRGITSRVGVGEPIFEDSNWKVKEIIVEDAFFKSGRVILTNQYTGEQIELSLKARSLDPTLFSSLRYGVGENPETNLKIGSERGAQVKILEEDLQALSSVKDKPEYEPGTVDETFDSGTESAVSAFQTDNALEATGELDKATADQLITTMAEVNIIEETTTQIAEEQEQESLREIIIKEAEKRLGAPYVWGGNGPSNFDCSGLIYAVYESANLPIIDRGATDYYEIYSNYGEEILSADQWQPGDLCFFESTSGIRNNNHIGIYYRKEGGKHEMIHASSSQEKVVITPDFETGVGIFRGCFNAINDFGVEASASPSELMQEANQQADIVFDAIKELEALPTVQAQEYTQGTELPDILLPEKAREAYNKAILNYQRIIREFPTLTIPADSIYAKDQFWAVLALRKIINLATYVESSIDVTIEFKYDFTNPKKPVPIRKTEIGMLKERASSDRLNALQTLKNEYSEAMGESENMQLENFFRYDTSSASAIFEDEVSQEDGMGYPQTVVVILSKIIAPSNENYVDVSANGEYTAQFPIGPLIFANKKGEFDDRVDLRITKIAWDHIKINDIEILKGEEKKNISESRNGKLYARYNQRADMQDGTPGASITFIAEDYEVRLRVMDTFFSKEVTSFTRDSLILDDYTQRKLGGMAFALDPNLISMAKISIVPYSAFGKSVSDFFLHIGIEKRAIQLSPEQMESQAAKARNLSAKITKITDTLEDTISIWMKGCYATSTALFLKNFVEGIRGESFARDKVMTVYKDICAEKVGYDKQYKNFHECFLAYKGEIESATDATLDAHKRAIQATESVTYIDAEGVERVDYGKLQNMMGEYDQNQDVNDSLYYYYEYEEEMKREGEISAVMLTPTEVQDILFNLEMQKVGSEEFSAGYEERSAADMKRIKGTGAEYNRVLENFNTIWDKGAEKAKTAEGLKQIFRENYLTGVREAVGGDELFMGYISASRNQDQRYVGPYYTESGEQIALVRDNEGKFVWQKGRITEGYFEPSQLEESETRVRIPLGIPCPLTDGFTIRFYESPHKGMPYLAPFPTPYGKGHAKVLSYDTVGNPVKVLVRVPMPKGDCDIFSYMKGQQIPTDRQDALQRAFAAIQRLTNLHDKSPGQMITLSVQGETGQFLISGTYSGAAEGQCEDFMSPEDCEILFQVCDPVMCPPSRFNFGGRWPVTDVVQTGVFGSIILGLPNFPHPAVPICLPGIRAGLQTWASILDSYADCLDEARETGKTSGICDRIRSFYVCDVIWREGLALANAHGGLFDILGKLFFDVKKGGIEYMYFKESMNKVSESASWFASEYAPEVFASFESRTGEEIGTYICKAAFFGNVPGFSGMLEELSKPESPPQFFAFLEEIPYSDTSQLAGSVPQSQYKVFFHIFAGEDKGIFYRIYLSDPAPLPGYLPAPIFELTASGSQVASKARGFLQAEQYVSETLDFLAPSGYRQVCVEIDGTVNCGFKQVTTDFGINYLSDLYLKQQLEKEITSMEDCISGSPSALALAQLPVASSTAVSEAVQGGALMRGGITRVCDSRNPGEGTDQNRWKKVGTCGTFEGFELYCWLDTNSVKGAITDLKFQDQALQDAEELDMQAMLDSDVFLTQQRSEEILDKAREAHAGMTQQPTEDTVKLTIQYSNELYQRSLDPLIRAEALVMLGEGFDAWTQYLLPAEVAKAEEEVRPTIPPFWQSETQEQEEETEGTTQEQQEEEETETQTDDATAEGIGINVPIPFALAGTIQLAEITEIRADSIDLTIGNNLLGVKEITIGNGETKQVVLDDGGSLVVEVELKAINGNQVDIAFRDIS